MIHPQLLRLLFSPATSSNVGDTFNFPDYLPLALVLVPHPRLQPLAQVDRVELSPNPVRLALAQAARVAIAGARRSSQLPGLPRPRPCPHPRLQPLAQADRVELSPNPETSALAQAARVEASPDPAIATLTCGQSSAMAEYRVCFCIVG